MHLVLPSMKNILNEIYIVFTILASVFIGFNNSSSSSPVSGFQLSRLPDLHWNTTNPMFQISNTDHIIDVNVGYQINIVCPHYSKSSYNKEQPREKFVIYNVDKEEFDTCRILSPKPRTIAYCTEPDSPRLFTLSFRSFSPLPRGIEYQPGRDYYFISTSSPDDLHLRVGGYCQTNNMKLVFKVAQTNRFLTSEARDRTVLKKEKPNRKQYKSQNNLVQLGSDLEKERQLVTVIDDSVTEFVPVNTHQSLVKRMRTIYNQQNSLQYQFNRANVGKLSFYLLTTYWICFYSR